MADAEKVLIPDVEVALSDGSKVYVKPWSWKQGKFMLPLVMEMIEGMSSGDEAVTLGLILDRSGDKLAEIAYRTVGMVKDDFEALPVDDAMSIMSVVFETCFVRPDGGGALGKLVGLANSFGKMAEAMAGDEDEKTKTETSASPSSSSSPKAIASKTS